MELENSNGRFKIVDKEIQKYYESMGRKDYVNEDGIGKFLQFCIENECDSDEIEDELSGDPSDCLYLDFDDNFPFSNDIKNESDKMRIMFDIIKKCHNNATNSSDQISPKTVWNLQITKDEYKQFKQIYAIYCSEKAKTEWDDHTFWFGLCLSFKNNFPFLQYLSQIYIREYVQNMLQNNSEYDLNAFIMQYNNNLINLSEPYKSITISLDDEKDQQLNVIEFMKSAIRLYLVRLLPPLHLPLPRCFGLIQDDIQDVANIITAVSIFCQRNDELRCPFQLDCMIACNVCDDLSDSDDDEEEKEGKNKWVGNIWGNLEQNKCEYYISNNKQPLFTSKRFNNTFNQFKRKLDRKYNNIDANYIKNYPQQRRVSVFVDRRGVSNTRNSVTFFEPASHVREFPNYKENTKSAHIFEWCIEATRNCIIPSLKNETTKNVLSETDGKLITFSFHVEQQNQIRCYMWWRGKCMLFLPQDITDTLPYMFSNVNNFAYDGYKSCTWRDQMFEAVYQNVTQKNTMKHLRKYQEK